MIKKHIKKLVSIVLSAVMVIGMSTTAFAATPMTLEEAKEYLSSYNVTKTNAAGKEYTTQYVFDSESDLNKAAAYIVEGLFSFLPQMYRSYIPFSARYIRSSIPKVSVCLLQLLLANQI